MRLSIITINRNNAQGLETTLKSINTQTCKDFEHLVIDGASTDNSVDVIKRCEDECINRHWISEPDKGIYNAMNKGIKMAKGDYLQFLNSGDCLVDDFVVERMLKELNLRSNSLGKEIPIFYGNMIKCFSNGKTLKDKCFAGQPITFLGMFVGTLNHSCSYIKRSLFDKYGLYDENLKIVSDWKWYLQAIILGNEQPEYVDMDVTLFDMTGISETNKSLDKQEREMVLYDLMPAAVIEDYKRWTFSIEQMKRLKRHKLAYKMVWFMERFLFNIEKLKIKELIF